MDISLAYDVIGLGICAYDLIGVAADVPQFGKKQPLAQWLEVGGGPVPTALVTLARLGARPCMHSPTGNDSYGAKIVAELEREGVATAGMQIHPGSSHLAFALAEPGQDRRTIFWHNDPAVLRAFVLDEALVCAGRALLLDTHLGVNAVRAARLANEAGKIVMLDAERVREHTMEVLPWCNVQIVSENFARQVTGEEDRFMAARALHERYGQLVVVTGGADGSWLVGQGEAFHCPAHTVEVVDTTGAGDVYHGAFLYGLLQGWELGRVARFASVTAALKCRALGGRAGIPQLEEVIAVLES
jgi:sulfofructose kinase